MIISSKKCMLSKTLDHLSAKANKALSSLKSNLNLLMMLIKLLLKVYDTMILPILLYCIEVWAPSGKFCFEKNEHRAKPHLFTQACFRTEPIN